MATTPEFKYAPVFQIGKDDTEYELLTKDFVSTVSFEGKSYLKIAPDAIRFLIHAAFHNGSFMLRRSHNECLAKILKDPESSENDKYVALTMLRNAEIAAKGILPICQDTGTGIVYAKRGHQVITESCEEEEITKGIFQTYTEDALRYSQNAPLTMYEEVNTRCNLPAQIDIEAVEGNEYKFLCLVKGGGSGNKTFLYQKTKAILKPEALIPFLVGEIKAIGTAACPPYHIAVVIGGTSAEKTMHTVKLATAKVYDNLPRSGDETGRAFRDLELEKVLFEAANNIGIGAQFGGKYFAHDVRVIRLSRHGGSCPIGLGVTCAADRNVKCKINADGLWIEKLDSNPGSLIPEEFRQEGEGKTVKIDLTKSIAEICAELTNYPVSTRVSLTGTIIVARDIAHARLKERLDRGEGLPEYVKKYPILYAGPAKTPEGFPCGSMGPTSSVRMDPYVESFMQAGGSLLMIGKGDRTEAVTAACKKYGGFYLGTIGGVAAALSAKHIKKIECIEYPDLGMEAIYRAEVQNFPAFILTDDKGNDFFKKLKPRCTCKLVK